MSDKSICEEWERVTINKLLKLYNNYRCNHPAKYKVTFKEGTRGKIKVMNVCGKHLRALEKRCAGAKKLTGWEANLTYETLIQNKKS